MSDKNPCPFCGDDSDYLRFLDLCAERANEIWRENEVRIMLDVYTSMDFVQIVRCRDCKHRYGCVHLIEVIQEDGEGDMIRCTATPDGYCKWGERDG